MTTKRIRLHRII